VKLWKTTIEILTDYDPGSMNLKTLAKSVDFGVGTVLLKKETTSVDQRDYGPGVLQQLRETEESG